MLKIIILGCLACGALALTEEQIQLMNSLHAECVSQTGVGEDVIVNARNGDFPQDQKLKCFMKCVFDEVGVVAMVFGLAGARRREELYKLTIDNIDDDGKLDIEGILAIMPDELKDVAPPVIRKCGTQDGADGCDAIFNTLKCYYETDKRGLSDEMQELADMLHATCVGETGAKEDDILNARKGIFADKEEFKCYINCLMAQMACIDDDGIVDEEATIAVLPEEYRDKAAPIIRKCGTKKGKTPCENAWLTHQCYQQEAPDDYLLI